jgi:excisionase family DNA binding protein
VDTESAQGKTYLTVGEAANLLGVHRNTVRNRIKTGRIKAHKVLEGEQEVYRIDGDSLGDVRTSAVVHTIGAHRTTEGQEVAEVIAHKLEWIVREYGRELGATKEQLGEERAKRKHFEEELERERHLRQEAQEQAERLAQELESERRKGFWARLFGG